MSFWKDPERREEARARFERWMAIPILIAAALLTAITLVLILGDLSDGARRTLLAVDLLVWVFFVLDYLVRVTLATPKWKFIRREWVDLLLVVLPLLQPLRLLGALLRVARVSSAWERAARSTRVLMRHRLDVAIAWSLGLVLIAAVITPLVEPDSAKIKTFWDGVWWAVVTMTTVGYGDLVPESAIGRAIGFLLMLVGIGIIGMITANLASAFIEPIPTDTEPDTDSDTLADADTDADADADGTAGHGGTDDGLRAQLNEIERKLDALAARLHPPDG